MEGPGLLRRGDDLLRGKQEPEQHMICNVGSILEHPVLYVVLPVEPGVPELHAGGEPDAHLAVRPVRGAPAGDVQQARDTTNLYSTVQYSTCTACTEYSTPNRGDLQKQHQACHKISLCNRKGKNV